MASVSQPGAAKSSIDDKRLNDVLNYISDMAGSLAIMASQAGCEGISNDLNHTVSKTRAILSKRDYVDRT